MMTSVAWGALGAGRNAVAPGRSAGWIAVAIALLALGAGAAACFTSPALAIAALALPAVPLLLLAPDLAILGLIAVLPFDALTSLDEEGAFALTRLLGIAVQIGRAHV